MDVQINYQASLVGNMFARYSRKVLNIIKELTLGTDETIWIKGIKCGRESMQYQQANCGGTSKGAQR